MTHTWTGELAEIPCSMPDSVYLEPVRNLAAFTALDVLIMHGASEAAGRAAPEQLSSFRKISVDPKRAHRGSCKEERRQRMV